MKDFVSFGTDRQSMYFMLTRFLKENINGDRVPQFQFVYIHEKTHPSQFFSLSYVMKYIICGV